MAFSWCRLEPGDPPWAKLEPGGGHCTACDKFYTEEHCEHKAKRKHLTSIEWWLAFGEGKTLLSKSELDAWLTWVAERLQQHDEQLLQQQGEQWRQWRSAVSALVSEAPAGWGNPRQELEQLHLEQQQLQQQLSNCLSCGGRGRSSCSSSSLAVVVAAADAAARLRNYATPSAALAEAAAARSEQPGCGLSVPVADLLETRASECRE